jgi:hypothetical protein
MLLLGGIHLRWSWDRRQGWCEWRVRPWSGQVQRKKPNVVEGRVVVTPPPPPRSWTEVYVDGPSPRIVEGEPERWGRAGLAALALVALPRSVAAATATIVATTAATTIIVIAAIIATVVIVIVVMVTTMSLTLAPLHGGQDGAGRGRAGGVVGVERMWRRHRRVGAEREFF